MPISHRCRKVSSERRAILFTVSLSILSSRSHPTCSKSLLLLVPPMNLERCRLIHVHPIYLSRMVLCSGMSMHMHPLLRSVTDQRRRGVPSVQVAACKQRRVRRARDPSVQIPSMRCSCPWILIRYVMSSIPTCKVTVIRIYAYCICLHKECFKPRSRMSDERLKIQGNPLTGAYQSFNVFPCHDHFFHYLSRSRLWPL